MGQHFKLVKMFDSQSLEDRISLILLACNVCLIRLENMSVEIRQVLEKRKTDNMSSLGSISKRAKHTPKSSNHSRSNTEPSNRPSSSSRKSEDVQQALLSHGYQVGLMRTQEELRGFVPIYGFNIVTGRRVKDGVEVFVRFVTSGSTELEILNKFNQSELRANSRNIVIPVLEFIPSNMGDIVYVVMEKGEPILNVVSPDLLDHFVKLFLKSLMYSCFLLIFFNILQKRQLVDGVKFLNEFGIIHHDIKPANLVFLHGRLYLIDFEFAKVYKQGEMEEEVLGTKSFIPSNLEPFYNPFDKEQFAVQKTIECLLKEVATSAEP